MTDIKSSLESLMSIDGALCTSLVDSSSGMVLGKEGTDKIDMDLAAAGNSQVVKAKLDTMVSLGINEEIEDILITLGTQYHVIRPIVSEKGLFFYLVLNKNKANLALARRKIKSVEEELKI